MAPNFLRLLRHNHWSYAKALGTGFFKILLVWAAAFAKGAFSAAALIAVVWFSMAGGAWLSHQAYALVAPERHEEVVEVFLPDGMDMAWVADFEAFSKGAKANDEFRSAVKNGARTFHISAFEAEQASLALRSSVVVDPLAKSRIDAAVAALGSAERFRVAPKEYARADFDCLNFFAEAPTSSRARMLCSTRLSHPGHVLVAVFGFALILFSFGCISFFSYETCSRVRRDMAKAFEERRTEIEACEEESEILGSCSCSDSKPQAGPGSI